jgi:hypothetical protein
VSARPARLQRPLSSNPIMLSRLAFACTLALAAATAHAEKVPLDDEQLRAVHGQGISIAVHLSLNTSVAAGFTNNGLTTYAIAQNFGGLLDLFSITIDPLVKPDGTGYLAIGLPTYLGAQDFGVRAIGVQTDASVPVTGGLGSLMLNGSAAMTGQLNVWAK